MKRKARLYLIVVSIAGLAIFFILEAGSRLAPPTAAAGIVAPAQVAHAAPAGPDFLSAAATSLWQNGTSPLSRLLLQVFIIISAAGLAGRLARRVGQPAVVGEMVAGILLGPSLFGLIAPGAFQFVFPASSFEPLRLFSQIGVCLFMFAVGMELDVLQLKQKVPTAIVVSHSSIVIPYLLGVALAWFLYHELAQPGATFMAFALFMGISMSITAFPVLVRILKDRNIFKTPLGSTATACAAVDDVTAWTILAFVVAIARATSVGGGVFTFLLVIVFVGVMLFVVRPSLPKLVSRESLEREEPSAGLLTIVVSVVLLSAFCTELIGIHALFGAFLAGTVMPSIGGLRDKLAIRVEHISSVLLLPVFFAFTGLRMQVGLVSGSHEWMILLVIIGVATLGKLGGSALAARLTGLDWRESTQLGALMNTRGLMELIALNIGYDLGILSQRIFTMLVIMALVTTAMTGPLLSLLTRKQENVGPLSPEPILS